MDKFKRRLESNLIIKNKRGDNLKKETFQMRISKDTRADLDIVAKHYNLSASAAVDMLIAKEKRLIDKQRKEDEGK